MKSILTFLLLAATCLPLTAQDVRITPMDNNTSADDFAPTPTNHGRRIYFSSERSGEQQIYWIERTSSGWSDPEKVSGDVNDGTHVGVAALSSDGQTMIFSAYEHDVESFGRTDLYMAKKVNGEWTKVTNLGPMINSDSYDAQPSLSSDGRTLYFVSDRFGSKGGTDIYVAKWTGKEWSAARPIEEINTARDEMSPVIAADDKLLSYASNKDGGSGGFDIYFATISGIKASNLKAASPDINTSADEMFYTSLPNSNQAYFTRGTPNGDFDNYLVVPNPFAGDPVTLVEGVVRDEVTKKPLGADVTITDLSTGKAVAQLRSDDVTGEYYATLTPGRQYSITARAPGYLFHSERYDVPPNAEGKTIKKDLELAPLSGGGGRLLVFFDYDKSELKPESYPELERVIELMKENNSIRMRFEGHTDDQGADDYNMELSKKRVASVRNYVVNGGIDASRVETEGFGESKPLIKETTDEARAMNRRVEMKVLK